MTKKSIFGSTLVKESKSGFREKALEILQAKKILKQTKQTDLLTDDMINKFKLFVDFIRQESFLHCGVSHVKLRYVVEGQHTLRMYACVLAFQSTIYVAGAPRTSIIGGTADIESVANHEMISLQLCFDEKTPHSNFSISFDKDNTLSNSEILKYLSSFPNCRQDDAECSSVKDFYPKEGENPTSLPFHDSGFIFKGKEVFIPLTAEQLKLIQVEVLADLVRVPVSGSSNQSQQTIRYKSEDKTKYSFLYDFSFVYYAAIINNIHLAGSEFMRKDTTHRVEVGLVPKITLDKSKRQDTFILVRTP